MGHRLVHARSVQWGQPYCEFPFKVGLEGLDKRERVPEEKKMETIIQVVNVFISNPIPYFMMIQVTLTTLI